MTARFAGLFLLHAVGNAVLLVACWYWLAVPDRNAGYIAFSALLAAAILFGFVWLQGAAAAAFRPETEKMPFRWTLRREHRVALGIAVVLCLPAVAIWLGGYSPRVAAWLSGLLTSTFRKPVSPRAVGWMYPGLLWILGAAWFVGALAYVSGRAPAVRSRRFWLLAATIVAVGLLLPYALVSWVPEVSGLTAQTVSLVVRFGLAYAIVIAAWLALAMLVGRADMEKGRPTDQPSPSQFGSPS